MSKTHDDVAQRRARLLPTLKRTQESHAVSMNRTDRLLAIVLELQRHRRSYCRADDLASTFEVSKRTIYRDIQALCAAGVPIAVAGRQGYALAEGYFLPPVSFTTDEALILALGSDFMSTNFDDDYRAAAHSAYRKIDAILPPSLRNQVDDLKRGLHFFATKRLDDDQLVALRTLRQAVAERKRIRLQYSKRDRTSNASIQTVREVDPYSLTRLTDDWYLTAYCHLRQAVRVFRLTRMSQVTILERTFEQAAAEGAGWTGHSGTEPIFVQVLFDRNVAQWARESHRYALIDEEETPEGVRITLLTHSADDMVRWLLSWGGDVRVLEPTWLQGLVLRHAERMLKNYRPTLLDD
jgi:predicted DNA-binding transcriptional regulator YafY